MTATTILPDVSTAEPVNRTFNNIDGQDNKTLDGLDYTILALLLIVSMAIGVFYAWKDRKDRRTEGFLMGDRSMALWPSAFSLMATFVSSSFIIGIPLDVYYHGTQIFVLCGAIVVAGVLAAELCVPVLFEMKVTSVNEYLEKRFESKALKWIASVTAIMTLIPNLGVVMYAPSVSLSSVTSLNTEQATLLIGIVCTIYTAIGGLKAVIWTDFIQYTLMCVCLFIIAIKGTVDAGGMDEVFWLAKKGSRLELWNTNFDIHGNNIWTVTVGYIVLGGGFFCCSQMQIQRTCAMPTLKLAKSVLYISVVGFIIMLTLLVYVGLVIFANYSHCDPTGICQRIIPDELLPYYVTQKMQDDIPGIPGLLVASIFAAALSTLSSAFNSVAALAWEDFLKDRVKNYLPEKYSIFALKGLAASIGFVVIGNAFIVKEVGDIYRAAFVLAGAAVGPLFAVFLIGFFAPFVNKWGAISGLVAGQVLCFWIVIGSISIKQDHALLSLRLSSESCPPSWSPIAPIPFSYLENYKIPTYKPTGLSKLYHIHMYMIPVLGWIVALITAFIVSFVTGNHKGVIDPRFLHPWAYRWNGKIIPSNDIEDIEILNGGRVNSLTTGKLRFKTEDCNTDEEVKKSFIVKDSEM